MALSYFHGKQSKYIEQKFDYERINYNGKI